MLATTADELMVHSRYYFSPRLWMFILNYPRTNKNQRVGKILSNIQANNDTRAISDNLQSSLGVFEKLKSLG